VSSVPLENPERSELTGIILLASSSYPFIRCLLLCSHFSSPCVRLSVHELTSYLLRDRDAIFGQDLRKQLPDMGIEEVLSTPRSPWQRAYIERVIGSIRRECLDQVIVFNEGSLRRILASYFDHYHRSRTHLSLGKDSPETRPVQPPEIGPVVAVRQAGGLHHRYERRAA